MSDFSQWLWVGGGVACRGEKLSKYCEMGSFSVDFKAICIVFQDSWQLSGGLILCVTRGCVDVAKDESGACGSPTWSLDTIAN